jgi:hypothetical protein
MFKHRIRIALTGIAAAALLVTASTGVASARYAASDYEYGSETNYRPDTSRAVYIEVHSTGESGGPTEDECHEFEVDIAELRDMQERFYDEGAFGDAVSVGVAVNETADAAESEGCFVIY